MKQATGRVVFHDNLGSVDLGWRTTPCLPALLRRKNLEECGSGILWGAHRWQVDLVLGLQDFFRNSLQHHIDWCDVVAHLINRQYTATHHLCFGVGEGWKDQTWTITEQDLSAQVECLKMFSLSRQCCDADFLYTHQNINHWTFTDVRITNSANDKPFVSLLLALHGACLFLEPS